MVKETTKVTSREYIVLLSKALNEVSCEIIDLCRSIRASDEVPDSVKMAAELAILNTKAQLSNLRKGKGVADVHSRR